MKHSTVFIFICRRPSTHLRKFATEFAAQGVSADIAIVCDLPGESLAGGIQEVWIDDATCVAAGYQGANYVFSKPSQGWDKALYFAATSGYDRCWFIEDDVLFRDAAALVEFAGRYAVSSSDLLCAEYGEPSTAPVWPHWATASDFFSKHTTAHAFVALCRVSGLLLKTVDALAKLHGRLCFMETMLPSICKTLNMSIETYDPAIAQVRWGPPVTEDEVRVLLAEGKLAIHPYKEIQTIE